MGNFRLFKRGVLIFLLLFMQEGLKNTQACQHTAAEAEDGQVFILRSLHPNSKSVEVMASFSPMVSSQSPSDAAPSSVPTLPCYLRDCNYFTPSFVLPEDKAKLESNMEKCLANHQRKVMQFMEEKHELLVPKPSPSSRFCLICKQTYDDYLTHISYPSHATALKSSAFYNDILELCLRRNPNNTYKFNRKIAKERKPAQTGKRSSKPTQKASPKVIDTLSTGLQSSQQVQLASLK